MARLAAASVVAAVLVVGRAPSAAADTEPAYYSTHFGSGNAPIQRIAARADGSVVVAGFTYEAVLPAPVARPDVGGSRYCYVAEFEPDGSLRRVSYVTMRVLPTDSSWRIAQVRALALGDGGTVWIAGRGHVEPVGLAGIGSADEDYDDAWVAKLAADGSVEFATNLGGSKDDQVNALSLTASGDALLAGTTRSLDFPVKDAFQSAHGGDIEDGFVARIRGDGSGLAWSSYLGGEHADDANDVAETAFGEVVVLNRAREPENGYSSGIYETDRDRPLYGVDVTRLSSDGALLATTPLPHAGWGGAYALAVAPDGGVIVGGSAYFGGHGTIEGFLLRLDAAASRVERIWRADFAQVHGIGFTPDGQVVGQVRYDGGYEIASLVVVAPDLSATTRTIRTDWFGGHIRAAACAPDGAVCLVGDGWGAPFGPAPVSPVVETMFVAKVPTSGIAPPSRLRVLRTRTTTVDLAWTGDGDPAVTYEFERGAGYYGEPPPTLVATLPGDVRSAHVEGLDPGWMYRLRLVAVFASGVKTVVVHPVQFATKPEPPGVLEVVLSPGLFAKISFESPDGPETDYEVQRRIGSDPWVPFALVDGGWGWVGDGRHFAYDSLVPLGDVEVRYRVRARWRPNRSAWVESAPVLTAEPTLRVRQTGGTVRRTTRYAMDVDVAGTFQARSGSSSVEFEPAIHELDIRVGSGMSLHRVLIPAGDAGWTHHQGVWKWDGVNSVYGRHRVTVDPIGGTFRIRFVASPYDGFARHDASMLVGMSYAGLSGGEVRTWEVLPGWSPNLVLR